MIEVVRAEVVPYALPFVRPVHTSRGTFRQRRGWLLRVEGRRGLVGWGDAACWPGFGAGEARTHEGLHALASGLVGARLDAVGDVAGWTAPRIALPEACHAVELALLDLLAREARTPLASLLASNPRPSVPVNALVADADEARAAVASGITTLKVKVGAKALEIDVAGLLAIRAAAPTALLRLDANGAWSAEAALRALERLAPLRLEWIEQPVAADDLDGLARVCAEGGVPVAVDEGLRGTTDLLRIADAGASVAVVKPMALGGLLPALALAGDARLRGLRAVVTTTLESVVGRTGALHLAAALPADTPACGLRGLVAADVAAAPREARGNLWLSTAHGLGFSNPLAPVAEEGVA